jgi:hypothetical protein
MQVRFINKEPHASIDAGWGFFPLIEKNAG